MNAQEMLARLAELCGILPEYQDLWGHTRTCSDPTRRALLGAMGLPAGSEAELRAGLEGMGSRAVRALPPALVVEEDAAALELEAWLPEGAGPLGWRLRLESGETRNGQCPPAPAGAAERWHEGVRHLPRPLRLPGVPLGYHALDLQGPGGPVATRLIVAPERCHLPPALERGERLWGFGAQLYAVRSRRNWGMGDFTDLRSLLTFTRESGGDLVGVNPLHALFPDAERASPYGPSSRRDFNTLYLDAEAIADFAEDEQAQRKVKSAEFQALLRALRSSETVDYGAVAAAKLPVLENLHRHFRERHERPGTERGRAFEAYRRMRGRDLRGLALFQALQEHFHREDPAVHGWQGWPEGFRDPDSPQVGGFAAEHGERVAFWEYLQWQADLQLGAVGARSLELGLGVGLYADLAVGVERGGAETWLNQGLYALGAGVGAPPDDFSLDGQDWGLPPMIPHRLRDAGFQAFTAMLQANMRHAGALRIDHVMGLMRLFWVPAGAKAAEGAYVAYPFQELMGILALESQRNQCLVIGEDLGTVPPEVRVAMARRGILSCHPLYFERDWQSGAFKAPEAYPREALVSVGTHDLPTLNGYWQGHDLDLRRSLGLFPSEQASDGQVVERAQSRAQLLVALGAEGLLEDSGTPSLTPPAMTDELVRAVLVFLARSPSMLLEIGPEDILGQLDQVNLPGTLDAQHPNWRRKLTLDLEEWTGDARFQALREALHLARGPAPSAEPPAAPGRTATIPQSTYRLQFNREFTLAQATALVPYLHALGVSHCYASPLLRARLGSPHGYDIIDHGSVNPEIGTPEDLARFVEALHRHGMGLVLDFVPNHMAVLGSDNAWWQDVLENGQASAYADFFDIDWHPLKEELRGKVLLPVLGIPYGSALEGGGITLEFVGARGEFRLGCGEHRFPVDPGEYPRILGHGLERLAARLGETATERLELESILAAFRHLPGRDQTEPAAAAERARDKEISKRRLASLWEGSEDIRLYLEENLRTFRGSPGQPQSFDLLHQLIQAQAFRLAYWRVASDEINYRRFFDISDLAGIRMEREPVFEATHALVLEWVRQGSVDGLRLDHPDGLYDPLGYFRRLQRACGGDPGKPLYLVAEKILAGHERLPADWPIHGETGYRFANEVNGLFVDGAAERRMDRIYGAFTGQRHSFEDQLYRSKALIIRTALASELNVLVNQLSRIALADRQTCDFTLNTLRHALSEVVASFPVYRTYFTPGSFSAQDRHCLEWAVAAAGKRDPEAGADVFDFIREVLSGAIAQGHASAYADPVHAFAMKFQQYTAPVMAKGMEDTCFYRYNRLVALNDVGGDPRAFGTSVAAFHEANRRRCRDWPHGMLASSTHDSKHSEDFRLRVDVLSEMPAAWKLTLRKWTRMNRARKTAGADGEWQPSRNDEYLLYQTLLGAWPLEPMDAEALARFRERIDRYMLKAAREAKEHTSWNHPDPGYEAALARFVAGLLGGPAEHPFLADLQATVAMVARPALLSGLSLVLLKSTAPGVPDFYQGLELPVLSLVDPDNRRPVDYPLRQRILDGLRAQDEDPSVDLPGALLATLEDGRAKCFVTWRALNCRREHPDLFRDGDYLPLHAEGVRAEQVCAFARRREDELAVTVAPRLYRKLLDQGGAWGAGWQGRIEVPAAGEYRDVFTGECHAAEGAGGRFWLPLGAVLAHFPVALLLGSKPK